MVSGVASGVGGSQVALQGCWRPIQVDGMLWGVVVSLGEVAGNLGGSQVAFRGSLQMPRT
jgi:hypothetical protein